MICKSCRGIVSAGKKNCDLCGASTLVGTSSATKPIQSSSISSSPQVMSNTPKAGNVFGKVPMPTQNHNQVISSPKPIAEDEKNISYSEISYFHDTLNLIKELQVTPKSSFNWKAFFFPVAYLYGFGASDNAKKVATTTLVPLFVLAVISHSSQSLAGFFGVVMIIWNLYISYLIGTRSHALVVPNKKYNLPLGIVVQVIFIGIASVLKSL
jgi:hypothetical protein